MVRCLQEGGGGSAGLQGCSGGYCRAARERFRRAGGDEVTEHYGQQTRPFQAYRAQQGRHPAGGERMQAKTLALIETVNAILTEYEGPLTLRQVFYRLVAAQVIENTERQYKRLSEVLTKAWRQGLVDEDRIIDRIRQTLKVPTWVDLSVFDRGRAREVEDQDRLEAFVDVVTERLE